MGFSSGSSSSNNNSQQSSVSKNQAYPYIQQTYAPTTALTGQATGAIGDLLGLNGTGAQNTGFNNYKNSSDYNFIQNQGIQGIENTNAAKGLLNSGANLKGITDYSSNMASTFLNSYLQSLTGLANTGLQAGQLISGAGNTANSQGTSTGASSGNSSSFTTG